MTQEVRDILMRLLKNNLISIPEIAMFKARKEKEKLLEIVERMYNVRVVKSDNIEVIVLSDEDVFTLIDYIEDEPITLVPSTSPITIPANPWTAPGTSPYTHPWNDKPWWQPDIVYCAHNGNANSISIPSGEGTICYTVNKA